MKENLKKMIGYYKPYKKVFFADTFFGNNINIKAKIIILLTLFILHL